MDVGNDTRVHLQLWYACEFKVSENEELFFVVLLVTFTAPALFLPPPPFPLRIAEVLVSARMRIMNPRVTFPELYCILNLDSDIRNSPLCRDIAGQERFGSSTSPAMFFCPPSGPN
jgi:hypothetical protein